MQRGRGRARARASRCSRRVTNAGCTSDRPLDAARRRRVERRGQRDRRAGAARALAASTSALTRRCSISASLSALGHAHSSPIVSGVTDWKAVMKRCRRCASSRPGAASRSARAPARRCAADRRTRRRRCVGSRRKNDGGRSWWMSRAAAEMMWKLSSSHSAAGDDGSPSPRVVGQLGVDDAQRLAMVVEPFQVRTAAGTRAVDRERRAPRAAARGPRASGCRAVPCPATPRPRPAIP